MPLTLNTPIDSIYLIGKSYAEKLNKFLNIHTVEDLLYHFPFRYDDLTTQKSISDIKPGETITLQGYISTLENVHIRNGKQMQKGVFQDMQGNRLLVTWFNQPYLLNTLKVGTPVSLAGKVTLFRNQLQMTSPKWEKITTPQTPSTSNQATKLNSNPDLTNIHTGRLVPIYSETYGVTSKWLRTRIKSIIKNVDWLIEDFLPDKILDKKNLITLPEAIRKIHFPENQTDIDQAKFRLGFDEILLLQLQTQQRKEQWHNQKLRHKLSISIQQYKQQTSHQYQGNNLSKINKLKPFLDSLPFDLTVDQQQSLNDIITDLNKNIPMNRLLEGDVGSGKTVVAAATIYLIWASCLSQEKLKPSHNNSLISTKTKTLKSILIAPTEVLANQHYKELTKLLKPFGIKIGFFTGAVKSKGELNDYDLYLGTHALLFQDLPYEDVALVIIDEQHRFGVEQRGKLLGLNQFTKNKNLKQNSDTTPHLLSMTATPIPRTVALSIYGDLSLSYIKTMPKGRKQIKTWLVPNEKRNASYKWISKQIDQEKSQAYFIYPLVNESNKGTMSNIKAAKVEYQKIQQIFPNYKVGLIHGQLKSKEKQKIMQNFSDHKLDILVSTSVIEVGIDVPNATLIIIEGAERFGLAQLHQLRGRVGRGNKQSYCLLFTSTKEAERSHRLKAMEKVHSGIELAELDLQLRGPGTLYGNLQSGFLDLKIANFNDKKLLMSAQTCSEQIYPELNKFPLLLKKLSSSKIWHIKPN